MLVFKGVRFLQHNPVSKNFLLGGINPVEKYARQNGFTFPKVWGENKQYLKVSSPSFAT